jgi:hypothetical protein
LFTIQTKRKKSNIFVIIFHFYLLLHDIAIFKRRGSGERRRRDKIRCKSKLSDIFRKQTFSWVFEIVSKREVREGGREREYWLIKIMAKGEVCERGMERVDWLVEMISKGKVREKKGES